MRRREQRVQENRLQAVEVGGQLGEDLLEQQDDIAGEEAAHDTAEEAEAHAGAAGVDEAGRGVHGKTLDGDHAGHEAGDERRALADGLGDVGGEHRNHEVHGGATVILICGNSHAPLARLADIVLRTVNYEALLTTVDFTFSKISATLIIEVIYSFLLSVLPGARDAISGYEELIQPDKEME